MSQETLDGAGNRPAAARRGKTLMQRVAPVLWVIASLGFFFGFW
jgi:hypothetical protein